MPDKAVFTNTVKAALLAVGAVPRGRDFTLGTPAAEWAAAWDHWRGHAVGVGLLRVSSCPNVLSYLDRPQRAVHDYWQATRHSGCPVLFLEFVECVSLAQPVLVSGLASMHPTSHLFMKITPFSSNRALQELVHEQAATTRDVIGHWANIHNQGRSLFDDDGGLCLSMCMPAPHLALVVSKRWRMWGFPLVNGRAGNGFGYKLVPVLAGIRAPIAAEHVALDHADPHRQFSPGQFLDLADALRLVLANFGCNMPQHQHADLCQHIQWLMQMRNCLVMEELRRSSRMFDLRLLISCVVTAGYLKHMGSLKDALVAAVVVIVSDPAAAQYFKELLTTSGAVPSPRTLFRARLSVHIGVCKWQQNVHEDMLQGDGVFRWATVDSSPQGGWEWVLHAATTMRISDAVAALRTATMLATSDDVDTPECAAALKRLRSVLCLHQGVPTVVGSGYASLSHKVHAVCHSTRLTASSWPAAAQLLNSTVTWTTDLGVEARFATFRHNLVQLFGDWIREEVELEAQDDGLADLDVDFDFQSDALHQRPPPVLPGVARPLVGVARDLRAAAPLPEDPLDIDFARSVHIAGLLHVIHNCTEDLKSSLS